MKIGIIGLPNVGKSTLFKALTNIQVDINNYPFCTIEPNIGTVAVPDERIDRLSDLFQSEKKIYATVEFVDIAGLVPGAAKGEGLGNKFLHNIREVDALIHVIRVFTDQNITHTQNSIDPQRDLEIINTELMLADLETVEKRLIKLKKDSSPEGLKQRDLVNQIKIFLNQTDLDGLRNFLKQLPPPDFELIKDLHLLSYKPMLYLFNSNTPEKIKETLRQYRLTLSPENYLGLDIKIEEELTKLTPAEIEELGLQPELPTLISKSYALLQRIFFFTAGKKEARAWDIPRYSTAPQAGRAIHSDFEEKFICAQVIAYPDLIRAGSLVKAKEEGLVRTEGKDYLVQDGDVIEFKI